MSKREVNLYLSDIDDAIATIKNYTEGMTYEELVDDRKTREAVILNLILSYWGRRSRSCLPRS